MSLSLLLGAVFVLALVLAAAMFSGRQVQNAADFSSASQRATLPMVLGSLTGTMVGGASTIGTAQLAFSYGLSAWWFTVGGGLGLILLGLFYARPLRKSGCTTLSQVVSREYGGSAGRTLGLLNTLGSFISVIAQILSGSALLSALTNMPPLTGILLIAGLMLAYVIFGGALGAGYVGIVKVVVILLSLVVCAGLTIHLAGGLQQVFQHPQLDPLRHQNLMARGFLRDGGAGLAAIIGFISTQANITSIISARDSRTAIRGCVLTGLLMPVVGGAGILVGLYMRAHFPFMESRLALPTFILQQVPGFFGGMMLAALLVTIVGSGAGISLGISNIIAHDLMPKRLLTKLDERGRLALNRTVLTLLLLVCALLSLGSLGDMILNLTFLSMGLRGAAGVGVFTTALLLRGRIGNSAAMLSMVLGVLATILAQLLVADTIDPAVPGLLVSLAILGVGMHRTALKKVSI